MNPTFISGDVFYTRADQQFQLFKVVAVDPALDCYHVAAYAPLPALPVPADIPGLPIAIGHAPIAADGFDQPVWLAHLPVAARELRGYYTYLQFHQPAAERIEQAIRHFDEALALSDAQRHHDAIDTYTLAYTLVPELYEAVDNRAFCWMDLGCWPEAIADFEESLRINPASDLAEFSIGECYFNLHDDAQAKARFEKALALNPDSALAQEFLGKVAARSGA
ncbi:tetratricopeptide repeat protein [Hymenobacter negativus]|uniref:Tetratricopeptide repeat protein n=1 Tax=Hymenobacter negativus TaxID=2795026 RepID=A0ABS3Q9U6_9BACT|nr:tetratricopeptide repeat protein [Hymenobacter negativus]MBO2007614.1 tetratricopeptide repeat protein [Hymenobacter negativus]